MDKPTSACVRGQRLSDGDAIRRVPGRALSAPPPCPCRLTPGMGRNIHQTEGTAPRGPPDCPSSKPRAAFPRGNAPGCLAGDGFTFGRTTSEPPECRPLVSSSLAPGAPSVVITRACPRSICRSPPRHSWSSRKPEGPADLLGTTAEDDDGGAAASRWHPGGGRGWRGCPAVPTARAATARHSMTTPRPVTPRPWPGNAAAQTSPPAQPPNLPRSAFALASRPSPVAPVRNHFHKGAPP